MDINQIQVGFRYRKDLGDLKTLAQSIADVEKAGYLALRELGASPVKEVQPYPYST